MSTSNLVVLDLQIGPKVARRTEGGRAKILNAWMLEMALTCYETFDINLHHVSFLLKSDKNIAVMTECSIIVHN